ncbi:MarR family winged helix-turn-helix transcriptional regulator [Nocardioides sp.]|uniref:MarR family winged helix-turn-helix transcriptional regulator n=1 Tax=Nocardioides sp. TaxID=35761 RepID=UPI0035290910
MPTTESASRTVAGLASELGLSVLRLRRRLSLEQHPGNPLSLSQMTVLGTLYRHGEMTLGDLAAHERVQPPSMTRTVGVLGAGGYVRRHQSSTDGRVQLITITERGISTLLADRKRRDAWLTQALIHLTADERSILRAAAPILDRLANDD